METWAWAWSAAACGALATIACGQGAESAPKSTDVAPAAEPARPAPSTSAAAAPKAGDLRRALELEARAVALIETDPAAAEALLLEQLSLDPDGFVVRYNLACARALQGDSAGAMDRLVEAVERGFVDVFQIRRDPHLTSARRDPRYDNLVANWPEVLRRHAASNLEATRSLFSRGEYRTSRDEALRIDVLSAMDERSTAMARDDLARLHAWGVAHVFPELGDEPARELDAWCVVVLPSPEDFVRWTLLTYGRAALSGLSGVGGAYLHDSKRLVAQDLGATLRHEFFHVLHWRSTTRLGQDHPIWIQEGLCSLVEEYELGPDGTAASLRPVPSWRTNVTRRLVQQGRALRLEQLAAMPRERFVGTNPLANYAQARTVFLYLWDRGVLKAWYAHYTANHAADPTGLKSMEAVLGKTLAEVERDYRAWVRALPEVAEQLRPGRATLGVDVDPGTGDGPVIVAMPRLQRDTPNPAIRAGLRVGDVITAIDGRATRDLNELLRILGEKKVGDEVEVSYRRRAEHGSARVRLVPRDE